MFDLFVYALFTLVLLSVVAAICVCVWFALFLRSVNRHGEGLRFATLRDRDDVRKLY